MTKLIVNAVQVLDEDIQDGVVSLSSSDIQYSYGRLVLPEFQREKLVNGQAVFDNVAPGKVIAQFAWDHNRTATVRATVPDTDSITLAELTLQQYDREPAVVSQMTKAVTDIENSLVELRDLRTSTAESASEAGKAEGGAKASEEAAKASETESARQAGLSAAEAAAALAHKEQTGKDRAHIDSQRDYFAEQVIHIDNQKTHVDGQVEHVDSQREHIDTTTAAFTTESTQAFTRVESAATRAEDAQASVDLVVEDAAGALRGYVKDDADRAESAAAKAEGHEAGAAEAAAEATKAEVEKLTAGAPEAFDTLKEIADELEKNETERAALATTIGKKADTEYVNQELDKKSDTGHTHSVEEIDGLQTELSRKASLEHVQSQVNKRPALFHGDGPPGAIEGAVPGDKYIDFDGMEIYVLPEGGA